MEQEKSRGIFFGKDTRDMSRAELLDLIEWLGKNYKPKWVQSDAELEREVERSLGIINF